MAKLQCICSCKYLASLKCKMQFKLKILCHSKTARFFTFHYVSRFHPAFFHVSSCPFWRLHGPTVHVTAQQLGSLAQTTSSTARHTLEIPQGSVLSVPHVWSIMRKYEIHWNNLNYMKWSSAWHQLTLKARHWGLTYLPKWRDPLEQWALGWSGEMWIASTVLIFYLLLSVP